MLQKSSEQLENPFTSLIFNLRAASE